jgi:pyroglutamyl-peptidase
MRVLLTAFEPFDGTGLNSSLSGCRAFLEQWGSEFEVRFIVLPVSYGPDVTAVEQALQEGPVDVILHTGQATGASAIRVERLAVNVRYGADSYDRALPEWSIPQQEIEPDGPPAYLSTLPVERIAAKIRECGVSAAVSNHAGIYLCNHALYHSLRRADLQQSGVRAGFLHVPCLPGQAGALPSMSAGEFATALRAAFECLRGPVDGV